MTLTPALRKFQLTLHVMTSVGWFGSVAVFAVLDISILMKADPQLARVLWLALQATIWSLLVPLAIASLVSGTWLAWGTSWGLFRHYWVIFKLALTLFATLILVVYSQTIGEVSELAAGTWNSAAQLPTALLHTGGALVVLSLATILAIYKPRGMTRYGQLKKRNKTAA